jgi:hypothetical protein
LLQFDDRSLAMLITAAARISYRKRSVWLKDIARQLEDATPSRNAKWCREARARARNGVSFFRIPADRVGVEEMLIAEGLLQAGIDHSHSAVENALGAFLAELIAISIDDSVVGNHS